MKIFSLRLFHDKRESERTSKQPESGEWPRDFQREPDRTGFESDLLINNEEVIHDASKLQGILMNHDLISKWQRFKDV
jgi:hypothetical protein